MALVSRHVPEARRPWIAGIYLLGLGLAAAIGPYLGLAFKGVDPRIPFTAASVALAVFVVLLAQASVGSKDHRRTPRLGRHVHSCAS
jgi:MFS family permease